MSSPDDIQFTRSPDGTRILSSQLWFPQPRDTVFAFFADAQNLNALTPPYLRFQVLTPPPIAMQTGTLIDYRLRLHGLPLRWRTRIAVWDPPHRFVDEQLRGPYRRWVHEHTFTEQDGGTLCTDRVEYAIACDWLVHRLFVQRDLRGIFAYRRRVLLARFGTAR